MCACASPFQHLLQAGRDIYDLGESLYAFLLRYGEEFDYETEAVSVASGGIVSKRVRARARACVAVSGAQASLLAKRGQVCWLSWRVGCA